MNVLAPIFPTSGDGAQVDHIALLTGLLHAPDVDPLFRSEIVRIPGDHPNFQWNCAVPACPRITTHGSRLCHRHARLWVAAQRDGVSRAEFMATAEPMPSGLLIEQTTCLICPDRPAFSVRHVLCLRHRDRWQHRPLKARSLTMEQWAKSQVPLPGFGQCLASACQDLAESPFGLCRWHQNTYRDHGAPGGGQLPPAWIRDYDSRGRPVPISYQDREQFMLWCKHAPARAVAGQLNLLALRPLLLAEVQWGLFKHAEGDRPYWSLPIMQSMINRCRSRDLNSLADLDLNSLTQIQRLIAVETLNELRLVYFTPAQTREAGFLETDHFGVRFRDRLSHYPLQAVTQRWLRDLLWDYLADLLRSPDRPETTGVFDNLRRGVVSLSAFMEAHTPHGGHDPALLRAEHMHRFVADIRHRERHALPSLGIYRADGKPSTVTSITRSLVLAAVRRLLRSALELGKADTLGLDREFIVAAPPGGRHGGPARRPFPDDVAQALADETNLQQLAPLDPYDSGLRDIWETIVATGRRAGEVLDLRLDCLGRYNGLPMLWHDQTKVRSYDQAIRIPEPLHQRLTRRQETTTARFAAMHQRQPTARERPELALFPTRIRNQSGTKGMSYGWYQERFRAWVDQLDLSGHYVTHQARHTLATNLLRHGAGLHHIRRYLGHVSTRMAEHYAKIAVSDIEDVLHHVWVAGPGAANPGALLCDGGTSMTRQEAEALAINLTRQSTPAEGGFCTFQPVVDGGACPWNMDCTNCDKFVLSGADLLYWRRKREQWASHAERAPTDAIADYMHSVFESTSRAIDGLESALSALGLLDEALALDLRRPQDYFQRVWSIGFRASELAVADPPGGDGLDGLDSLEDNLDTEQELELEDIE